MLTKLSTTIGILLFCNVQAQIVYTFDDYGEVNNQFDYKKTTQLSGLNFSTNGNNITWNYNLVPENDSIVIISDVTNSIYKPVWCNSKNYDITTCDSEFAASFNQGYPLPSVPIFLENTPEIKDIFLHSQKSNNQLVDKLYGFNYEINNSIATVLLDYSIPDILYKFPMTMGDSYIEPYAMEAIFPNNVSHVTLSLTGNRENNVDGWGTLVVAGYTYNDVIRLKTASDQQLAIVNNGNAQTINKKTVSYQWFSKSYKMPILQVNGVETNGKFIPNHAIFIKDEAVLATADTKYKSLNVYPNPVKDIIKTNIADKDILHVEIYNTSGQIVNNNLNINHLKGGNYILKIVTKKGNFSQKIIKQ